ncbi:CAP domain-containing protein [Clostridium perfringens]|uniref:CAP domain-containing protein n=1 Tax=Clostridium perfringens TaxID=1502 RepID=UPI0039E7524D
MRKNVKRLLFMSTFILINSLVLIACSSMKKNDKILKKSNKNMTNKTYKSYETNFSNKNQLDNNDKKDLNKREEGVNVLNNNILDDKNQHKNKDCLDEFDISKLPDIEFELEGDLELENKLMKLINSERLSNNILPLRESKEIKKFAITKSKYMITHDCFSHKDNYGATISDWLRKYDINNSIVGENILSINNCNEDINLISQIIMKKIMNSDGDKDNILNSSFKEVAIGVYKSNDKIIITQIFVAKSI